MSDTRWPTGAALIADERRRQVEVEGWTPEHDAKHGARTLAWAAICYQRAPGADGLQPEEWPWGREWWKPKSAFRNLVRAGALFLAARDVAGEDDVPWPKAKCQDYADRVASALDRLLAEVCAAVEAPDTAGCRYCGLPRSDHGFGYVGGYPHAFDPEPTPTLSPAAALGNARVRFWMCPRGHSKTRWNEPLRVTVEWDDDGIAHCTTPGCPETSAPPPGADERRGTA